MLIFLPWNVLSYRFLNKLVIMWCYQYYQKILILEIWNLTFQPSWIPWSIDMSSSSKFIKPFLLCWRTPSLRDFRLISWVTFTIYHGLGDKVIFSTLIFFCLLPLWLHQSWLVSRNIRNWKALLNVLYCCESTVEILNAFKMVEIKKNCRLVSFIVLSNAC